MIQLADVNLAPTDVSEALDALETVTERLRERGDPRAVFPDVYGIITRNVKYAIQDKRAPTFLEPEWVARLAGRFCEKYLVTLDASFQGNPIRSSAWAAAYQHARMGVHLPVQDALLGINAHINYDLAQGLYENIVGFNHAKDERMLARYRHDHDKVNEILEASVAEIFETLTGKYNCRTLSKAARLKSSRDGMVSITMSVLKQWRARVWDDLLELLNAPTSIERELILYRMDRLSGHIARALCTVSTAYQKGSLRLSDAMHQALTHLHLRHHEDGHDVPADHVDEHHHHSLHERSREMLHQYGELIRSWERAAAHEALHYLEHWHNGALVKLHLLPGHHD